MQPQGFWDTDLQPPKQEMFSKITVPETCKVPRSVDNPLHYVLLGETGVGKSTLGNLMLSGKGDFTESAALTIAGTKLASTKTGVNPRGEHVTITDTQGWLDPDGHFSDLDNREQMIQTIRNHGVVHSFILVFNGMVARWSGAALNTIDELGRVFPRFWNNTVVVLNFMP